MIAIDYKDNFTCSICKDNPEIIVLDGITLGTLKDVPKISHKIDEVQQFNLIPTSERVFISNFAIRKKLKDYSSGGLAETNFNEMLNNISSKELVNYILFSNVALNGWRKIISDFPKVNVVIDLLSYSSPLCGIFQCSLLTQKERKSLVNLSKGEYLYRGELQKIFDKINSMKQLFDSLPTKTKDDGQIAAHDLIFPLIKAILLKIDHLYKHPSRQPVEFLNPCKDYFSYFPAFPINYK